IRGWRHDGDLRRAGDAPLAELLEAGGIRQRRLLLGDENEGTRIACQKNHCDHKNRGCNGRWVEAHDGLDLIPYQQKPLRISTETRIASCPATLLLRRPQWCGLRTPPASD